MDRQLFQKIFWILLSLKWQNIPEKWRSIPMLNNFMHWWNPKLWNLEHKLHFVQKHCAKLHFLYQEIIFTLFRLQNPAWLRGHKSTWRRQRTSVLMWNKRWRRCSSYLVSVKYFMEKVSNFIWKLFIKSDKMS